MIDVLVVALPVLVLLAAFEALDAFRLLEISEVLLLLAGGAALAAAGFFINGGVLDAFPIRFDAYSRFVAPPIEEALKAALIVLLLALNRMGYLIDAALTGFAVGAGFALAENLLYLKEFAGAGIGVWIVRGFGTAIMHAGAGAVFAALLLALFTRRLRSAGAFRLNPALVLPPLAAAVLVHGAFNQFGENPLLAMAVVIVAVPAVLYVIFALGESHAHRWLASDLAAHARLVADLDSGAFEATPDGATLARLARRLGEKRGAELMDYVRLNAELAVAAEEALLSLEARRRTGLPPQVRGQLERLHALEKRLGRVPVMAVRQHLRFSRDDLWKLHELEKDAGRQL